MRSEENGRNHGKTETRKYGSPLGRNNGLLYKLIPTVNTVIFLDDIERVIDTIDIHKLLGAINGLVEQRGYKVVVINPKKCMDVVFMKVTK